MKNLLITIGLLFSLNTHAALIDDPHGDISIFIGSNTGLIIDAGSENLRFEIISAGDTGFSLKYAFAKGSDFKIWLGVGKWNIEETISDNSGNWNKTSFTNIHALPVVFAEIDFETNYFIRASHYEGNKTAYFGEMDIDGNLINQKTVTKKLEDNSIWIGYKFRF